MMEGDTIHLLHHYYPDRHYGNHPSCHHCNCHKLDQDIAEIPTSHLHPASHCPADAEKMYFIGLVSFEGGDKNLIGGDSNCHRK